MNAILTLSLYVAPFLILGIAARWWVARRGIGLSDVRAEGTPDRARARFLLGIWRRDDPG